MLTKLLGQSSSPRQVLSQLLQSIVSLQIWVLRTINVPTLAVKIDRTNILRSSLLFILILSPIVKQVVQNNLLDPLEQLNLPLQAYHRSSLLLKRRKSLLKLLLKHLLHLSLDRRLNLSFIRVVNKLTTNIQISLQILVMIGQIG